MRGRMRGRAHRKTFKNEIAGFRDAWDDAHENGLHYNLDKMYKEGSSGQRRVARTRNNDQSDMRLYNALRSKHEDAAFVALSNARRPGGIVSRAFRNSNKKIMSGIGTRILPRLNVK